MANLKHAYLILAHNGPRQLDRLLSRLNSPGTWFFLHIDKKVSFEAFKGILENPRFKLTAIEREKVHWGGFGIVKATLNGLRQICAHEERFDHIHLISGSDYPLVSNQGIDGFFSTHPGKIFINYFPLPASFWPHGGMLRLQWYHFIRIQRYNRWKWYTLMGVNKLLALVPAFRRKFPAYLTPFGGSQWWSITPEAAAYVLQFIKEHPDYVRFHRHTLAPDECFFQTILANAKHPLIRQSLVDDNLRYIVWHKPGVSIFPLLLGMDEFAGMRASRKLWARKFQPDYSSEVLDALDSAAANEG